MKSSVVGFAYSRVHSGERYARAIQELLSASGEYRRMGSAALMLAHVADGRLDGFYASHLNSWDVLAGLLLAQEAGAAVNDFLSSDGLWNGNAVFASAPGLRRELLSILQDAGLPAPSALPE
jgi:myo-inositol-1(or 4)-monophosphatase